MSWLTWIGIKIAKLTRREALNMHEPSLIQIMAELFAKAELAGREAKGATVGQTLTSPGGNMFRLWVQFVPDPLNPPSTPTKLPPPELIQPPTDN